MAQCFIWDDNPTNSDKIFQTSEGLLSAHAILTQCHLTSNIQLLCKWISDFHPFQDNLLLALYVLIHSLVLAGIELVFVLLTGTTCVRVRRGCSVAAQASPMAEIHLRLPGCGGRSGTCSTPGCPGEGAGCPARQPPRTFPGRGGAPASLSSQAPGHDAACWGMSLWPARVSCSGRDPSQLLMHLLAGRAEKSSAQGKLSSVTPKTSACYQHCSHSETKPQRCTSY